MKYTYGKRPRLNDPDSLKLSSRVAGLKASIVQGEDELRRRLTGLDTVAAKVPKSAKAELKPESRKRPALRDLTNVQSQELEKKEFGSQLSHPPSDLPSILSSPLKIEKGIPVIRRSHETPSPFTKSEKKTLKKKKSSKDCAIVLDPEDLDGKIWVKQA